jgi:hypothetical protein
LPDILALFVEALLHSFAFSPAVRVVTARR